jgi:CRISPR-associated protein Csm2
MAAGSSLGGIRKQNNLIITLIITTMTFNNRQHGGGRQDFRQRTERTFDGKFLPEWITSGITQETVAFSEKLGEFIKNEKLTTSQIRNVFGEIKRIQLKGFDSEKPSFYLLKPKMAYAAKRADNLGIKTLKKIFDQAHAEVSDKITYQNFVDFFESILAYHKAYGGRD